MISERALKGQTDKLYFCTSLAPPDPFRLTSAPSFTIAQQQPIRSSTSGSLPYTLPFTQALTRAWLYVTIIDINTIILQYYSGYVGVDFLGVITHGN